MKTALITLFASACALCFACGAPGGDCTVIVSACGGGAMPNGCTCSGSNTTEWTCTFADGTDEDCCADADNACTDDDAS